MWAGSRVAPPCWHRVGGASLCTSSSLAPGRVVRVGRDMAALVEPLGLERGKRSRGRARGSSVAARLCGPRQPGVDAAGGCSHGGRGATCGLWAWEGLGRSAPRTPRLGLGVQGTRWPCRNASSLTSVALPAALACLRGPHCILQTCPGPWSCWSGCSAVESCPRRSCRPCSGSCRVASVLPSAR